MKKRILFAAPVTFDRITLFISQYIVGLARAARELGHEVRVVQTTENMYNPCLWKFLEREFNTLRKYFKPIVDLPHDLLLMHQMYQEVKDFKADILFLYLHDTAYFYFVIDRFKKKGVRVITWRGLNPLILSEGIVKFLRKMDYTFMYDSEYIPYYQKLKISNVHTLPMGCDISYHESIGPNAIFKQKNGVDVCFVGILDQHREKYLRILTDFKLGIWTWDIANADISLKKFYKGVVYAETLVKVFKSAKIVINIHRDFEIRGGNYRLFEIPACGAFQLVDEKKDIGKYFEIGKEIVTYKDEDDLKKKVKYYLEHPEEREAIARAGYQRVKKNHTLTDRMKRILKIAE